MKKTGISLRTAYVCIIVVAVIISVIMVLSTFFLSATFTKLSDGMDEYIELDKAANDLMDASDYLTEKVQRFTVGGKVQYMEEYFTEANENKRRERAISVVSKQRNSVEALQELKNALRQSRELMKQEYYAMRLVIEAKGYTDYPPILDAVELSEDDAALSPEEKMHRATELVLGETYYEKKDLIRKNMQESLDALEDLTRETEAQSSEHMHRLLIVFRVIIIVQTLGIFVMIFLTSYLGINPVLKAVDRIKDNDTIPEAGANEFRYLARAYNEMYHIYKSSVDKLNFKASHDELTGVYNRSGFELLMSTIDLRSSYFLLFDVDDFKDINDNFGHKSGDKALKKVADTLRRYFRSDDYVCRIGGDEFAVFMAHADEQQHELLEKKVADINRDLADTSDGVTALSVSVGISHGHNALNSDELMVQADKALYVTKQSGKHGCSFYNP